MVKTITLRGIDGELEQALRATSRELSTRGLNATVLHVLREALGLAKRKHRTVHHDLDALAGTWSDEDLAEFENATTVFEQVDEEFWR